MGGKRIIRLSLTNISSFLAMSISSEPIALKSPNLVQYNYHYEAFRIILLDLDDSRYLSDFIVHLWLFWHNSIISMAYSLHQTTQCWILMVYIKILLFKFIRGRYLLFSLSSGHPNILSDSQLWVWKTHFLILFKIELRHKYDI
jgi:hypothetical protein